METKTITRDEVWALLEKAGCTKAVVAFSGGGDEGGVDTITLFGPNDAPIRKVNVYCGGTTWSDELQGRAPETDDQILSDALSAPVYDKYRTFAVEYQVDGKVVWDVASKTVNMTGSESFQQ